MTSAPSHMRREIDEIPEAAARLTGRTDIAEAGRRLAALDPPAVLTVARGSSDHAATVLRYAIELGTGRPVASAAPSVASVFGGAYRVPGLAALAISQSGSSTDLAACAGALRDGGAALTVLTNTPGSPLARLGRCVDVAAGPERAIAATKSFVNSVLAGLWMLAAWTRDEALADALARAPERLARALEVDTGALATMFGTADRLCVIGRGPALGVAGEIALKAIELCGVPAFGWSAAEVRHGPAEILRDGFPVLAVGQRDTGGLGETLGRLERQGARMLDHPAEPALGHPLVDPLITLVPIYGALEAAARLRTRDPDRPEFLRKETVTL